MFLYVNSKATVTMFVIVQCIHISSLTCFVLVISACYRVPPGHGKSWNLGRPFSRPGKSWKIAKVMESHWKWW